MKFPSESGNAQAALQAGRFLPFLAIPGESCPVSRISTPQSEGTQQDKSKHSPLSPMTTYASDGQMVPINVNTVLMSVCLQP